MHVLLLGALGVYPERVQALWGAGHRLLYVTTEPLPNGWDRSDIETISAGSLATTVAGPPDHSEAQVEVVHLHGRRRLVRLAHA
jgi:hypothetical protein